jgi:Icc-related predicted phosphoesterase
VLAGDLLGCPSGYDTLEQAQRADAAEIVTMLSEVPSPVFYVMGNDDFVELVPTSASMRSVHGIRIELDDLNFVGYQYSLPFITDMNEKPEEEIRKDLEVLGPLVDSRTVLVTHCPAHGILDVGMMDRHAGSVSIKELVDQRRPLVHIHGHVHQYFGREGRHFNVAAARHRRAMLIDTETLDHEVIEEKAI